jgi:hypothetical protein
MVILFDRYNNPEDIYEIIFATKQQVLVGKALIKFFKDNEKIINKSQMSNFATNLHEGNLNTEINIGGKLQEIKLSYNKRQFYDRILTPFRSMGIIDYDMYKKVYILSNLFCKELKRIADLWEAEFER